MHVPFLRDRGMDKKVCWSVDTSEVGDTDARKRWNKLDSDMCGECMDEDE